LTHNLPDDNKIRDVVTAFYRVLMDYRRDVAAQCYRVLRDQDEKLADIQREVEKLRNRVEILEVRQAGDDRRIP